MPKRPYTLSEAARQQRRAATAARSAASPRRDYATVRIERPIRDAAEAQLAAGESLSAYVGQAVRFEISRRHAHMPAHPAHDRVRPSSDPHAT